MTAVEAPPLTLGELAGHLSAFLERFEVGELSTSDAAAVAAGFGRIKRMALTGEILCLNRAAASSAVRRRDDRDGAKWAGQQLGTTPGHAAELLKLADGLDAAPHTRDALLHGEVSAEQAAEVVRTQTTAPGSETDMLDRAGRGSLTELKRRGRRVRAAAIGPQRQAEQIRRGRYLRGWVDDDGAGRGAWSLPAAEHAEVMAILEPYTDQVFHEARRQGRHETVDAYRADALVRLATGAITAARTRSAAEPTSAGPTPDADEGPPRATPASGPGGAPMGDGPKGEDPTGHGPTATASAGDGALAGQLSLVDTAAPDVAEACTDLYRGGEEQSGPTSDSTSVGVAAAHTGSVPSAQEPPPRADPGHPNPDLPADAGPEDPGPDTLPPTRLDPAEVVVRVTHTLLADTSAHSRADERRADVAEVVGVGPVPVTQVRTWMRQGAFVAVVVTGPDPHDVRTVVHLGRRSALVDRTWLPDRPRPRAGPAQDATSAHVKILIGLTVADLTRPELTALVAAVATRGVHVDTLVHRGRHPNAAQRSALQWRSPECAVTGCANRIRLEADHVVDWRLTGHTTLGELEHLCRHHHRMKTYDGYRLQAGTGKRRLLPPAEP